MTQDLMGEIYCYTHVNDSLFAKYFIGIWARLCFSLCNSYIPTF